MKLVVPGDVPSSRRALFKRNMSTLSKKTDNIFLFAGDQHIEHLNDDFYGKSAFGTMKLDHTHPEFLFNIAENNLAGGFATHYGLVSRYGQQYKRIPYIIKMNAKTNLVPTSQQDPYSKAHTSVADVLALKKQAKLNIIGVGYTIYLGSQYEALMLEEAARSTRNAHAAGLLSTIWMYPRGKAVKNEKNVHLIAGGAGVANSLGADVVKVNYPGAGEHAANKFKEVVAAAGNTKVICSGGSAKNPKKFFSLVHDQLHQAGCAGVAVGRNIHQHDYPEAVKMSKAIHALVYKGKSVTHAMKCL